MAAEATEVDVDGVMVRVTNPDKPFYPKLGKDGTKGKLINYYRAVAAGPMLTALRDRPTHLQRFPDGIDGEEIFGRKRPLSPNTLRRIEAGLRAQGIQAFLSNVSHTSDRIRSLNEPLNTITTCTGETALVTPFLVTLRGTPKPSGPSRRRGTRAARNDARTASE